MNITSVRKTIAALVTGMLGWATQVVTSDAAQITAGEWIGFATVLAVTAGVYQVPNDQPGAP